MPHSISDTFQSFKQLIDADRERTSGSLDILERINRNAANKYMNIADSASGLDNDRQYLNNLNAEIDEYCKRVDALDKESLEIEKLVKEIEEWSKELQVKSRRMAG